MEQVSSRPAMTAAAEVEPKVTRLAAVIAEEQQLLLRSSRQTPVLLPSVSIVSSDHLTLDDSGFNILYDVS